MKKIPKDIFTLPVVPNLTVFFLGRVRMSKWKKLKFTSDMSKV